jgi:PKD repeat protein
MVNRTSDVAQVIPIWIKAGIGTLLTLEAPDVAENQCLVLEDIETGWTGGIEPGFSYEFSPNDGIDHHRFNLIVGGTLTAASTDAACESAQDGTIAVAGPDLTTGFELVDAAGDPAGTFSGDATSGTFSGLAVGTYTLTAITDGCADIVKTVEVSAEESGTTPFDVVGMPDHIGCYDDHGGVSLDIDGGHAPYTVAWDHGAEGASIEVAEAGVFHAVITDAAGCADSTSVEVLAAPQVTAGAEVDNAVVALIDGEAEVVYTNTSSGATAYQWNFGDGGASTDAAPVYAYTAGGAYTVGLNAWNDYCSDTHQLVVTVEVVSSVGSLSTGTDPILERKADGWSVLHPEEAFSLDIFDLTGRQVHRVQGFAGEPVMLDPSVLPVVSLIRWSGEISGRQKTWRLAR